MFPADHHSHVRVASAPAVSRSREAIAREIKFGWNLSPD
jgi:hypothetical protein